VGSGSAEKNMEKNNLLFGDATLHNNKIKE
jgi:hypothetical protein